MAPAAKKGVKEEKILLGRPSNNLKVGIVGLPNVGYAIYLGTRKSILIR
jgi:obg-like ATPase 1